MNELFKVGAEVAVRRGYGLPPFLTRVKAIRGKMLQLEWNSQCSYGPEYQDKYLSQMGIFLPTSQDHLEILRHDVLSTFLHEKVYANLSESQLLQMRSWTLE